MKLNKLIIIVWFGILITVIGAVNVLDPERRYVIDLKTMANINNSDKVICNPESTNYWAQYKIYQLKKYENVNTLLVGTSRGSQLTQSEFQQPFYNASLVGWSIDDYYEFVSRAYDDGKKISNIILVVDPYILSSKLYDSWALSRKMYFDSNFRYLLFSLKTFLNDYKKIPVTSDEWKYCGVNAAINQSGYRRDGSTKYPDGYLKTKEQNVIDGVSFLPLEGNDRIHAQSLERLDELIEMISSRNTNVIIVTLPITQIAIQKQSLISINNKESKALQFFSRGTFSDHLKKKFPNVEYYNFYSTSLIDDSIDYVDSLHPTQSGMRKLIHEIKIKSRFNLD